MSNRNAKTLLERVSDLEAEWDIRNLISNYLIKADSRDVQGYAETFTPDGVLDIEGLHFEKVGIKVANKHEGREAIAKVYSTYIAPVPCFMWHLAHAPHIEVEGDRAKGRWGWTAVVNVPLFGPMQAGGVYNDEYLRTDEGWKIKTRTIISYFSMEYGKWNENFFFAATK